MIWGGELFLSYDPQFDKVMLIQQAAFVQDLECTQSH